jgi:hypothetical protein
MRIGETKNGSRQSIIFDDDAVADAGLSGISAVNF